jgi:hypothetical protein
LPGSVDRCPLALPRRREGSAASTKLPTPIDR